MKHVIVFAKMCNIYTHMFFFSGEPLLIHYLYFLSLSLFLLICLSYYSALELHFLPTSEWSSWDLFSIERRLTSYTHCMAGGLSSPDPALHSKSQRVNLFPQHLFLNFFGCISFIDEWPCSLPMGWIGWMRGEERVANGYGPTTLIIMEST